MLTTTTLVVRALNLSIFVLPVIMAAGAFVGAPRLPAPSAAAAVVLACGDAPAPVTARRALPADEGCRELPAGR